MPVGIYNRTKNHSNRIAKALMGNSNARGAVRSEKTRKRIAERLVGRSLSEKHINSLKESWVRRGKMEKEIRKCACGCGYRKEVYVSSTWRFKRGHWARMHEDYRDTWEKKQKSMVGKNMGKRSWAKGLTKETSASIANAVTARKKKQDQTLAKMLKANNRRPNKFEMRGLEYLEKLFPGRFKYTGDGTCIINGRSADALDAKTQTVVLFNGVYWHLKRFGYSITEENKRLVERKESHPFLEAGYSVMFIWEDELGYRKTNNTESVNIEKDDR